MVPPTAANAIDELGTGIDIAVCQNERPLRDAESAGCYSPARGASGLGRIPWRNFRSEGGNRDEAPCTTAAEMRKAHHPRAFLPLALPTVLNFAYPDP